MHDFPPPGGGGSKLQSYVNCTEDTERRVFEERWLKKVYNQQLIRK